MAETWLITDSFPTFCPCFQLWDQPKEAKCGPLSSHMGCPTFGQPAWSFSIPKDCSQNTGPLPLFCYKASSSSAFESLPKRESLCKWLWLRFVVIRFVFTYFHSDCKKGHRNTQLQLDPPLKQSFCFLGQLFLSSWQLLFQNYHIFKPSLLPHT